MLTLPSLRQVGAGVLAVGLCSFLWFCVRLYQQRRLLRGLPGPPYHPILGHLPAAYKLARQLPPDVHPHMYAHYFQKMYNLPNVFYFDTWPFGPPILFVIDPDAAAQVTQTRSLNKHPSLGKFLKPLLGSDNMVALDGPVWKKLRTMFNPGFSLNHLMTLVPGIVDNTTTFVETLTVFAESQEICQLEEEATRLTVDIIGRVVLDTDLNSQRSENPLVSAFRSQVSSLPGNTRMRPWIAYNPVTPFVQWRNTRTMDNYIKRELEKRFASKGSMKDGSTEKKPKQKHVIDLALETYQEEFSTTTNSAGGIDPDFVAHATSQIKTFIFAGHDTTSSTICYVYHFLSKNPEALRTLREEHDAVFGTNPSAATELIKNDPSFISTSKLPFTTAVIKETLRIYPAASSVRVGNPDIPIVLDGKTYPTHPFMTWIVGHGIHRRPDLFPLPLEFHPERFMPDPPAPFPNPVPKDAWRPFERGPRNCIGQELAMLETKVIMAMTVRSFDFAAAYTGPDFDGMPHGARNIVDGGESGSWNTVDGDRAYQILLGTAKPKGAFPCRVFRVGEKGAAVVQNGKQIKLGSR